MQSIPANAPHHNPLWIARPSSQVVHQRQTPVYVVQVRGCRTGAAAAGALLAPAPPSCTPTRSRLMGLEWCRTKAASSGCLARSWMQRETPGAGTAHLPLHHHGPGRPSHAPLSRCNPRHHPVAGVCHKGLHPSKPGLRSTAGTLCRHSRGPSQQGVHSMVGVPAATPSRAQQASQPESSITG